MFLQQQNLIKKILVRLDYIHNDNHRLEYTYKLTEGDRLRAGGGRTSFAFESNSYLKTESTET